MRTIEELKRRQLAKEQELASLREEIRKQKRNNDYRQKMLVGAVVLMTMRSDPEVRGIMLSLLNEAVRRSHVDRDRALLQDVIENATPINV